MHDVIIVGARCAGGPTAMLLARSGYRVLCVDKSEYPYETACSQFIQPPGVVRLQRWGLLEAIASLGGPPIRQCSFDIGRERLIGSPGVREAEAPAYCLRRDALDNLLVNAAIAAGAEFRSACTTQELLFEQGAVCGIRACTRAGTMFIEKARMVIGADGTFSAVARFVKAEEYKVVEPLTCSFYSQWSGVPVLGVECFLRPGAFVTAAPTGNGSTTIRVSKVRSEFRQFRGDVQASWFETLGLASDFAERVRTGRREEPFAGTADATNLFRQPYGPGWALVGDAGYRRDPITAHGISDAFRDAELLAAAIDAGFSGRSCLEKALAEYHQQRDLAVSAMYQLTCNLARLAPPSPQDFALFQVLGQNQPDTDRFLGTLAGTVSLQEFYSNENLGRLLRCGGQRGTVNGTSLQALEASLFCRAFTG